MVHQDMRGYAIFSICVKTLQSDRWIHHRWIYNVDGKVRFKSLCLEAQKMSMFFLLNH